MEGSKQLWMIGLLFTSILLIQLIQVPHGNLFFTNLGSVLSSYGNHTYMDLKDGSFENGVTTSIAIATSRMNNSLENGVSMGINNATSSLLENGVSMAIINATTSSLLENGESTANATSRLNKVLDSRDLGTAFGDTSERTKRGSLSGHEENGPISPCFVNNNHDSESTDKNAEDGIVSVEMVNDILLQSQSSSSLKKTATSCSSPSDHQLLYARSQIEKAEPYDDNSGLYAPLYWNVSRFMRSYELMEKMLKIYVYKEGRKPVFHQPRLNGIYASEGWFMKLLESNTHYVTTNPQEAHLFYLPFSSQLLAETVYVPNSRSYDQIKEYLKNYLDEITTRYPFWNTSSGADHFLVACHDWAPEETRTLMANCIKALCNADMKEGFQLGKDVSLPETYIHSPKNLSPKDMKGTYPSERHILAFYAGKVHGYLRPILLQHWENKDPIIKVFRRLRSSGYIYHMKNSKYCLCPRGYEVNSPRVVEAIMYGCVPVIISDNFVPPFLEVLDWNKFSIFILEKDIPNLKNILMGVSERRYLVMHQRVKMVRQHFLWHKVPVKYDMFHMILHSIWYNRVFRHYS